MINIKKKNMLEFFEDEKKLRKILFNIRFEIASGKLSDTSKHKKHRKQLARLLTKINICN